MELKNVIHYYIEKDVKCVNKNSNSDFKYFGMVKKITPFNMYKCCDGDWKPILRKIDSLTDDEKQQILSELGLDSFISLDYFDKAITDLYCMPIDRFAPVVYFQAFHLLVKLGVDLFGLIDNNHAIDKATL